jgi:hypothetical protein
MPLVWGKREHVCRPESPEFFRGNYLIVSQNVVGKVRFHIPLVGYVANFVKTPLGFILLLCVPGFIIIGMELRTIWTTISKRGKHKAPPKRGGGV